MKFEDRHFLAADGLRLHARVYEPKSAAGETVVCLAGLTRNARDFHLLALHLSRSRRVICMDYRGRGGSDHDPDFSHYNVAQEAEDVIAGMTAFGIEYSDFIGTSRGGIILHLLSAMRPSLLGRVVLNDIGPQIEGAGLMQIKAYLERAPKPKDWADAAALQKALHGKEFPALSGADWEIHARAIYRERGKDDIIADFDPALLKTMAAVDPAAPLPSMWNQFAGLAKMPLLAVRGENSKLLSEETVAEMGRRHPGMRRISVPGQGHAPMLWTADLPRMIADFLDGGTA
jgi:pimeloyl-ACP methyl ester carboxylesterase